MVGFTEVATLAAAKKVGESVAREIYENTTALAASSRDKLLVEFGIGFNKYLKRNYERCRFVKTLLHRIDPVEIEKAYVDPVLKVQNNEFAGSDFLETLSSLKRIVLTAMGGSGKSMFVKYTFLQLCRKPFDRIPLFVELRDFNSEQNLKQCILRPLSSLIKSFNLAQLEYGLSKGKFIVLLDGLDEVDFTLRDSCSKQLLEITYQYPDSLFLVTSRPDDRFESWHEFFGAEIVPLTQKQAIELITKIDFDRVTKKTFIEQIKTRLFQTHETFLSNPLLCTMMLMTYSEFEEIPNKMHLFYGRAFDALFSRHDKTKPGFKRKFYTKLAEDDFKRVFSTFCLSTYLARQFSFEEGAAKKFIKDALAFENISASPDEFLRDLSESVSILTRDGAVYSFLHRSFQEYFVSVFLADRQIPKMYELFDKIFESRGDSVSSLLFELNRDAFESKFFLEKLRRLKGAMAEIDIDKNISAVVALFFVEIGISKGEVDAISLGPWFQTLQFVTEHYLEKKRPRSRLLDSFFDMIAEIGPEQFGLTAENMSAAPDRRSVASLPDDWVQQKMGAQTREALTSINKLAEMLDLQLKAKRDLVAEFLL